VRWRLPIHFRGWQCWCSRPMSSTGVGSRGGARAGLVRRFSTLTFKPVKISPTTWALPRVRGMSTAHDVGDSASPRTDRRIDEPPLGTQRLRHTRAFESKEEVANKAPAVLFRTERPRTIAVREYVAFRGGADWTAKSYRIPFGTPRWTVVCWSPTEWCYQRLRRSTAGRRSFHC
jgi:hypothetical protein